MRTRSTTVAPLPPLFAYLRALLVATGVFAAPEDWGASTEATLNERIRRATHELAGALTARPKRTKHDEFADVVPLADLLGGR